MLLVEHDMEIVLGISDEITVMTQGRVIASGTPDAVSRDPLVQDAYLGAVDAGIAVMLVLERYPRALRLGARAARRAA